MSVKRKLGENDEDELCGYEVVKRSLSDKGCLKLSLRRTVADKDKEEVIIGKKTNLDSFILALTRGLILIIST